MTIKRTNSGLGLPSGFSFSRASEVNGICVISGMPALDPDGKFVPGTFQEERFTFQAAALPFGAKIEIQAVAARGT